MAPTTPSRPASISPADRRAIAFPQSADVLAIVDRALAEDVGRGDVTTEATVPSDKIVAADLIQKAPGRVCGLPVVELVFSRLDPSVRLERRAPEGSAAEERRVIAVIHGPAAAILTGERTALNFLQRLSGVATAAGQAVALVAGTSTVILDTRKTTPGLRVLEKYAVRVGGARNHRAALDDGVLVKENHIRAAGGIAAAVAGAQARVAPGMRIEVEVTSLDELEQAIAAGADFVLLDNFDVPGMAAAVRHAAGRVPLEASGGVTLQNLPAVAATGVDYVSLGALTHSAGILDFSLLVHL